MKFELSIMKSDVTLLLYIKNIIFYKKINNKDEIEVQNLTINRQTLYQLK